MNLIGAYRTAHVVAKLPDDCDSEDDAEWIATLGPQIAPHLSSWLRATADVADREDGYHIASSDLDTRNPALRLARSILGETEAA